MSAAASAAPVAHVPAGAWRVAAVLAVTQVVHWGSMFYAFSVLMPAVTAETGWPRGTVVGAFSAGLLVQAGAALGVGPMLDRLGPRSVMAAGSVLAGLGLWLAGRVESLWQFYAVWAGIGAVMAATLYEAAFTAVAAAFGRAAMRPGIALVTFAGGLASTVFWPLTAWLVADLGWRTACTVLALVNLACALPHAAALPGRAPPPRPGTAGTDLHLGAVCRQTCFWALAFVNVAIGFVSAVIGVHLVPLLEERGLGSAAPLLAGLLGVAQVAGRVIEFGGSRRWPLRTVGLVALLALAPASALLAWGSGIPAMACAIAVYGLANGVMTIVRGALPAQLFGTGHYGAISSALAAPGALARAAGPVAAGWLWAWSGGYAMPVALLAVLCLLAALALAAAVPAAPHS
ncbi:MFS transporter [Roseomonas sp. E05]|uniref:MFS transporter n=1 Tax=Roseomonas sp. E05 TaxID=3046310 RepID=UPI0024BA17EE|nr:MFS transporter [Roseomonas sp. E05]MDJ0387636.1 MFS transporter [Roseomonas sp. E05]